MSNQPGARATLRSRAARIASLAVSDGSQIACAVMVLAATRIALWIAPFDVVVRAAARMRSRLSSRARRADRVPVRRVVRWVEVGARMVPSATCLVRALAAEQLLAARGFDPVVRFGVARERGAS